MTLRELKRIVLDTPGATWEPTNSRHFTVRLNGVRVCTIPGSASDPRSLRNAIAQLRRGGIAIPRK